MVSPIIAVVISFLLPGIGQVVQGETKKGLIMFVIAIILSALSLYVLALFYIISFIYAIYAAYDAYKMG